MKYYKNRVIIKVYSFFDEIGIGEGRGYNVALPLLPRTTDNDVVMLYDEIVIPILQEYKPELLIVSAGFDAYEHDPIGILGFTEECFAYFGTILNRLACEQQIPVVNMLEGGYNIPKLPALLKAYLSGYNTQFGEYELPTGKDPTDAGRETLKAVKEELAEYWNLN